MTLFGYQVAGHEGVKHVAAGQREKKKRNNFMSLEEAEIVFSGQGKYNKKKEQMIQGANEWYYLILIYFTWTNDCVRNCSYFVYKLGCSK